MLIWHGSHFNCTDWVGRDLTERRKRRGKLESGVKVRAGEEGGQLEPFLVSQANILHPWTLFRMLQLQHHQLLQPACPQTSQTSATNGLPPSDSAGTCKASNSLLLSELQRENSFELAFGGNSQLLQPHFFGVSVSPVSSAAHLLDTHLYISSNVSPVGTTFSQQQSFSAQSPSYDAVTLQHGDCEMEDLTSNQLGKFVLVKWELWLLQLTLLFLQRTCTTVPWHA